MYRNYTKSWVKNQYLHIDLTIGILRTKCTWLWSWYGHIYTHLMPSSLYTWHFDSTAGNGGEDWLFFRKVTHNWKKPTEPPWELRLGMWSVKPFFSTKHHGRYLFIFLKKSFNVSISQNLFYFTAVPQAFSEGFKSTNVPNMCLSLHSLSVVCVSFSCVFCPSFCQNI